MIPFDSSTDEEEDFGVVLTEETQTALRQAFDDIERKIAEKNKIPSQYKSA